MNSYRSKKLQLNKTTLRRLQTEEMSDANGGAKTLTCTINTYHCNSKADQCWSRHCLDSIFCAKHSVACHTNLKGCYG